MSKQEVRMSKWLLVDGFGYEQALEGTKAEAVMFASEQAFKRLTDLILTDVSAPRDVAFLFTVVQREPMALVNIEEV